MTPDQVRTALGREPVCHAEASSAAPCPEHGASSVELISKQLAEVIAQQLDAARAETRRSERYRTICDAFDAIRDGIPEGTPGRGDALRIIGAMAKKNR